LRYGSADELLEVQEGATTRSLSYDARGNLIGILTSGLSGTTVKTFEWDSESRLVRVVVDGVMRFEGDYLEGYELSEERTPSWELLHTWFAGNIVASRSAASFEEIDRSLTVPRVLDSNLARGPPDDRRILVTDQLSSTLGETDSVGGVIGERRYTLYGEVREGDPADGVGFHGARIQEEAGLYYLRNRWYDAELGRFVSRDPIEFNGGLNLYTMAGGKPLLFRDPLGLDWRWSGENSILEILMQTVEGRRALSETGNAPPFSFKERPYPKKGVNIAGFLGYEEESCDAFISINPDLSCDAAAATYVHEVEHLRQLRNRLGAAVPPVDDVSKQFDDIFGPPRRVAVVTQEELLKGEVEAFTVAQRFITEALENADLFFLENFPKIKQKFYERWMTPGTEGIEERRRQISEYLKAVYEKNHYTLLQYHQSLGRCGSIKVQNESSR